VSELRLGISTGRSSTDAVVMDARNLIIATATTSTTPDLQTGIRSAVAMVKTHASVDPRRIHAVMHSTELAGEALLEPRLAGRVAVLRIGSPLTWAIPPLATWPPSLRETVSLGETIVRGGAEHDGRSISTLDAEAIIRFLARVAGHVDAVAITGVFATVSAEHELEAAELVRRELGSSVHLSLSHEIGSLGLLERENATVINAALVGFARELARTVGEALVGEQIDAELFLAASDGSVMAPAYALRFPVRLIGAATASSMRGAAHLSGIDDAVVVHVGETSTLIGALLNGFPRESSLPREIVGIRTSLRMPELRTLQLGGGSIVHLERDPPSIGPDSVGPRLGELALVHGGDTATLIDVAAASGRCAPGWQRLDEPTRRPLSGLMGLFDEALADRIERATTVSPPPTLVVVGPWGVVVADRVRGVGDVIRPADSAVSSAIGAAIAPVTGWADRICPNRPETRHRALENARADAVAHAIAAGADPASVRVVGVEEEPLTHLIDPVIQIHVRAAGPRG
jgi:N-methylhydantoinase A/oxoprolinase/acetone carboxylase beta subunit